MGKESPLEVSRAKIDEIDERLLGLLKERNDVITEIVAIKAQHSIQIYQPDRFASILDRLTKKAKNAGLSPALVGAIWHAIHEDSLRQQKRLRSQ